MNAADRRIENITQYNRLMHLRQAAREMRDTFNMHGDFSKQASSGRQYSISTQYYRRLEDEFGNDTAYSVITTYGKICQSINFIRRQLREYKKAGVLDDAEKKSVSLACIALETTFPSMRWAVVPSKQLSFEYKNRFYGDNTVSVRITWDRKVKQNNIEVVKAGDGFRFIMDANEVELRRLNEEGIRAYKVQALKVKHKQGEIEEGWVLAYDYDDKIISAFHAELGRAESLINRRIKDTIEKILLDVS